jgi:hypothetical protein
MFKFGKLQDSINSVLRLDQAKIQFRIYKDKEIGTFIIDLNRIEQLFKKGINSEGDIFGGYAFDQGIVTFKGNTKSKKFNDPYILYDEGEFYKSFKVQISKDEFDITANDTKEDGTVLTEVYGKEILGLTTESKNELAKKILPILIREVKRLILT